MGLTSAQRYNKRMDEIWENARKLGAFDEKNLKMARKHEEKMRLKSKIIDAKIQAKVWRGQMKGKRYDTVTKKLIRKLKSKYPELNTSEIEHLAVSSIK